MVSSDWFMPNCHNGPIGFTHAATSLRRCTFNPGLRVLRTTAAAAGGIGDPAAARAALAGGAAAVVMGTRFVASDESAAHERCKARLTEAVGEDTVLTDLFDVGWPESPHRVLRNSTYERWEAAGRPPSGERPGEGGELASGILRYAPDLPSTGVDGEVEAMAMYSGQSVGSISTVEPAGAIMDVSPLRCAAPGPARSPEACRKRTASP
jgi:nitronate monooxygenase